jgi:diguanylate cyclase (GGDEF)-like protein/putative nucleotidyltransferase with HDIG domain
MGETGAMRLVRTRLISRAATCGLAAVITFLAAFALWSAVTSERSASRLEHARRLTTAYTEARFAMDDERLLEHQYRIGHGGHYTAARRRELHDRFDRLADRAERSLQAIRRLGDPADRRLSAALERHQRAYHDAMDGVFRAAHMGNEPMARMEGSKADRGFSALKSRMTAQNTRRDAGALAQLDSLSRDARRIRSSTLIAIPLALILFMAFALLLRTYRRRADDATRMELQRLEAHAFTDNLTDLRNHRAFEEDLARQLARAQRKGGPLSLVLLDLVGLKQTNDTFGHQAGDERLKTLAEAIRHVARASDGAYRIGGDEFALILEDTLAWDALRAVRRLEQALAGREAGRHAVTAGVATSTVGLDRDTLIRHADLALIEAKSVHRSVLVYSDEMERALPAPAPSPPQLHHLKTIATALATAVDARDSLTRSHSETVAELCKLIAAELGLDPARRRMLRLAGLLHDVGKIGIADVVLQKSGPLTPEEFEVMRTHVSLGHSIVCATDMPELAEWILHHHERIDGTGYPDGLDGDEIPLESRVILVADAFEALTSDRPYRGGRSDDEALAEIERHAGTQFDAECVEALARVLGRRSVGVAHPPAPSLPA